MKFPLCKLPSQEWKEWSKSEEDYCSSQHMQPVCNLWMVMADSIKIRISTFSQEAVLREKKIKKWSGGGGRVWEGVERGAKKSSTTFFVFVMIAKYVNRRMLSNSWISSKSTQGSFNASLSAQCQSPVCSFEVPPFKSKHNQGWIWLQT